MGIIKGVSPAKMSGSIGNFTYRQTKFGTVVSEKVQKKANPSRSLRQMRRRTVLANLSSFFAAFHGALDRGFENKPANWYTINAFVNANSERARVFLTKQMVANGAGVVDAYQITRGSLRPIAYVATGNAYRTDLALGSLVLSADTTVGQLSMALVQHNAEFAYGDQISFFSIRQDIDANGTPRMTVAKAELTLDKLGDDKVWDIAGREGFQSNNGFLGMDADSTAVSGGFAYVHSRDVEGSLKVSTQFIESTNAAIVAQYSSAEALQLAIDSYGGLSADPFLKPDVSGQGAVPDNGNSNGGIVNPTPSAITISVASANPTMGSASGSGNYVEGATVTLTATANSGYHFTQWNDGNTQNPRQITASESKTYTASFAADGSSSGGMMGD